MGLIRKLFYVGVFVLSTYCWLILFEHGPDKFVEEFPSYYQKYMGEEEEEEQKPVSGAFPNAPKPTPKGSPVVR